MGGEIFQSLRPFFTDNNNLAELIVEHCRFGAGCAHQLSLALRSCNKSLKFVRISDIQMGGERLSEIVEALSIHPQLKELSFQCMHAGRNECTALATLLRVASDLNVLNLCHNDVDDEGVDDLARALTNGGLQSLALSYNRGVRVLRLCWKTQTPTWRSSISLITTLVTKERLFWSMHWPETAS